MNVLIGCEKSGVIRDAFRARGHNAWSCDLARPDIPASGHGHIYHLQGDVMRVINGHIPRDMVTDSAFRNTPLFIPWDLFIVHPDCTYLTSSGLHWNGRVPGRAEKTEEALGFVRQLFARSAHIPRMALENPIGRINTAIRKPDQYIQPHEFGHNASKKTGLWLRNLPPLTPTYYVPARLVCCGRTLGREDSPKRPVCPVCGGRKKPARRWGNQTNSGQNRLGPSPTRAMDRARTYQGWAEAMADQWGRL